MVRTAGKSMISSKWMVMCFDWIIYQRQAMSWNFERSYIRWCVGVFTNAHTVRLFHMSWQRLLIDHLASVLLLQKLTIQIIIFLYAPTLGFKWLNEWQRVGRIGTFPTGDAVRFWSESQCLICKLARAIVQSKLFFTKTLASEINSSMIFHQISQLIAVYHVFTATAGAR